MVSSRGPYVNVIVDQPGRGLARAFSYLPPKSEPERLQIGSYVLVPLGARNVPGFVVGFPEEAPPVRLRAVMGLLLDEPLFGEGELREAEWLAEEYCCSLGDALRCYLPPGSTRRIQRHVKIVSEEPVDTLLGSLGRAAAQRAALQALIDAGGQMPWEALAAALSGDPASAVRALQKRGLVEVRRELARPTAQAKTRRTAVLAVPGSTALAIAELRAPVAPRQAEVLRQLAEAAKPLPTAGLNPGAVFALQRDGFVVVSEEVVRRAPGERGLGDEPTEALEPTNEQREALQAVQEAVAAGGGEILLHGVTGSGKTEVYIQAIAQVRRLGKSALALVPEISLTPQLLGRFRARFGDELALLHSAIGAGERFDEWHRVRTGEARIVVGARSAIFAPCRDLGLVIIDEEHERAYKQDRPPRYDARRVAAHRCRREGAVLLLGSATPSVETYYRFSQGEPRRRIVELPRRIDDRPLPDVELVDMREETRAGHAGTFSRRLMEGLGDCLAAGNQAILFLNRRGFSTFVMCRECGYALRCPDCVVSLTYHHGSRSMLCHHCDRREPVPDICPSCEGTEIGFQGLGTERVADQVQRGFPDARVARMDRDTTATKGAHGGILREFASGRANVLVGTQMIAKGLDLPNVTLVGVLNADVGLNRPDFRAAEHTFQLLAQVGGRAGRAGKPGQVIVQTYNPDNYAIRWAAEHDFLSFYHEELERRREVRGSPYPPFGHLLAVHLSDADAEAGAARAMRFGHALRELAAETGADITIGGPAPAPLAKLRGRYRFMCIPRGPDRAQLRALTVKAMESLSEADQASLYLDVDPIDMM